MCFCVIFFVTCILGPNHYGIKRIILLDGSANAPWATASCNPVALKRLIEGHLKIRKPNPATSLFTLLQDLPVATILAIQRNLSRSNLAACYRPAASQKLPPNEAGTLFNLASLMYGQSEGAGALFYRQTTASFTSGNQLISTLGNLLERAFDLAVQPLSELVKYVYDQMDAKETGRDEASQRRQDIEEKVRL